VAQTDKPNVHHRRLPLADVRPAKDRFSTRLSLCY
jgi:hypothetical protein